MSKWINLILLAIVSYSCAYNFSTLKYKPPAHANSIAIGGIVNRSNYILPHQILWDQLQRGFASTGRLQVKNSQDADLYLRATVFGGQQYQFDKEPRATEDEPDPLSGTNGAATNLNAFPNLFRASMYSKQAFFDSHVQIEVWNLANHKLIFKKTYGFSGRHMLLEFETTSDGQFIGSEKTFERTFRGLAGTLAGTVVSDLMTMPALASSI